MNSGPVDSEPFSGVAQDYDASFTNLPSVRTVRKRIHALIHRYFPGSGMVLDLACGTGEDAFALCQEDYHVVGADRSEAMLLQAAAKCRTVKAPPRFIQMDASSLSMLRDSSFDAILSNFGGLNCVPNLRATLEECHRVLKPDGMMVLCLLGAYPVWEEAAFLLRGARDMAFRRHSGVPVQVPVGKSTVYTRYYPVRCVRRITAGLFDVLAVAGLNVVAPPPASQSFAFRHPELTAFLFAADRFIQAFPLLRAFGDHTVFVLRRRSGS